MSPLRFSVIDARRFHRRATLLDTPAPEIQTALEHHGFIQIDPINVCGRMHDLILRHRVTGYREGDLMRHLHGSDAPLSAETRTAFEHHLPDSNNLAAMPLAAWPYLLSAMRSRTGHESRWSGRLDAAEKRLAKHILSEIGARGALSSSDIDDEQRQHHGWGSQATLAHTTLHKLFFHGEVVIAQRRSQRRYYDLPARVLPAATLSLPEPSEKETARWIALLKLRQRRLVTLTKTELPLVEDRVRSVEVPECSPLYCLREDAGLLDETMPAAEPLLLAPLDPLIYHRPLTSQLWDFDYTWEAYTPAAKRVRGYYALPILAGTELVGHIDAKADRSSKKLKIVSRSVRRGFQTASATAELARFLGLKKP